MNRSLTLSPLAQVLVWIVVLTSVGCSSSAVQLDGFDAETWKSDPQGCNQKRSQWVPVILEQKTKVLALPEKEVIELLGKPDQIELYKRNQKLYHYRISPGASCSSKDSVETELQVRFNAMGRAKEIYVNTIP